MSAWLGQVPLRLSREPIPGPLDRPAPKKEQSRAFLGRATLGSQDTLGQDVGGLCCNPPSGGALCFYERIIEVTAEERTGRVPPGSVPPIRECVPIWTSPARKDGAPDCIQGADGQWKHPSCGQPVGAAPAPAPAPSPAETESAEPSGMPIEAPGLEPEVFPTTGEPIPATGVDVLPPPMTETYEVPPTGAWPGQPFPQMAPPKQVPLKQPPSPVAPPPAACPLGPVPLSKWAESCIASKF